MTLEMKEEISFYIEDEEKDLRLDKLLSLRFPDYSRSYFSHLFEKNLVFLDGIPAKKREKGARQMRVSFSFEPLPLLEVTPEKIPLDILFEDDALLIINKPSCIVTHPAPGHTSGTLANALLYHCQNIDPTAFATLRPGIVHRLDKETSGVLIMVKTAQAHAAMAAQFANRTIEKYYWAVCVGSPIEGPFSAPVGRHPKKRTEMAISPQGKEALSVFRTLKKGKELSLVEVEIKTGRTHQIRVHLKELRSPVLGDIIYGNSHLNEKYKASRQLLHAQRIKFFHPFSGVLLEIQAPLPSDMKNFIDWIQAP